MKSSTALNGGEDRVGEPQETRKTRLWKTHHEDLQRERKRVAAGEEGSRQGFFAKVLVFLGSMVKGNSGE